MRSKKNFRIGQRVQSAEDVSHTFVIRKSRIPERIYFGANRWWTKNELQPSGVAENPETSSRLNGIAQCVGTRSNAYPDIKNESQPALEAPISLEEQECLFCRVRFQPKRRWQKFHSEACRLAHWKKQERLVSEAKAPETLATVVIQ